MQAEQPSLVTLNVDVMKRSKNYTCGGCILIAILAFYVYISSFLPNYSYQINSDNCTNVPEDDRRGRFCSYFRFNSVNVYSTYFMNMGSYNQMILLRATPIKGYYDHGATISRNLNFTMGVESIREDFFVSKTVYYANATRTISCDFKNTNDSCDTFTIMFIPQLDPGDYKFVLYVTNARELDTIITGLEFSAYTMDPDYYRSYIAIRFLLFFVSLLVLIGYSIRYCKIPPKLRLFEHHAVFFMLPLLSLFNDPLMYLNVVAPSKFSLFISIFFNSLLPTYLMVFWMTMFQVCFCNSRGFMLRILSSAVGLYNYGRYSLGW